MDTDGIVGWRLFLCPFLPFVLIFLSLLSYITAFSCKAGEFLDMKDQSCKSCAEGRYSLGTGVRFDEWDELPHGFANVATTLEVDNSFSESAENCTT